MPNLVRCPECNARVRARQSGTRIRCPECDRTFTPPDEDEDDRKASVRLPAADEDDEPRRPRRDDEPRKRPRPKKQQQSSNVGLIIGILVLVVLVLSGGGVGAYFLIAGNSGKKDGGKIASKPNTPDNPNNLDNPQVPAVKPGLTAENFQKIATQMSEAEVIAVLGEPSSRRPEKQIPFGGPQGRRVTVKELVWQKQDDPKSQVTCGFAEDRLIDGSGMIDGKRVNARRVASKVSRANYEQIGKRTDWNKLQIAAILGSPSRNLGPQPTIGGMQSAESFEYSDGINRITVHWYAGGTYGGVEWHSR